MAGRKVKRYVWKDGYPYITRVIGKDILGKFFDRIHYFPYTPNEYDLIARDWYIEE